jgi:hypothetical protein
MQVCTQLANVRRDPKTGLYAYVVRVGIIRPNHAHHHLLYAHIPTDRLSDLHRSGYAHPGSLHQKGLAQATCKRFGHSGAQKGVLHMPLYCMWLCLISRAR